MVKAAQIAKGPPEEEKLNKAVKKPPTPRAATTPRAAPTKEELVWGQVKPYLPDCIRDDPRTPRRVGFLAGFYGYKAAAHLLRRIFS